MQPVMPGILTWRGIGCPEGNGSIQEEFWGQGIAERGKKGSNVEGAEGQGGRVGREAKCGSVTGRHMQWNPIAQAKGSLPIPEKSEFSCSLSRNGGR